MPIAKHLIVENGVLKVTDKHKPGHVYSDHPNPDESKMYQAALESWKQEALVVEDQDYTSGKLYLDGFVDCFTKVGDLTILKDGVYDAPAGLEYDAVCKGMTKENCHNDEECWDKNKCLCNQQVAILSFASPKEETPASKEKPDFKAIMIQVYKDHGLWNEKTAEHAIKVRLAFAERIWNDHVEPRDKQIAALQEEIRQLKNEIDKFPCEIDFAGFKGRFQSDEDVEGFKNRCVFYQEKYKP